MGWVKIAKTLYCGYYYNFRDYLIYSHHAHILITLCLLPQSEIYIICCRNMEAVP